MDRATIPPVSSQDAPAGPRPWLLLLPAGVFLGFLVIASLLILRLSFGVKGAEWATWSLDSYRAIFSSLYLRSILLTFRLSIVSAAVTVILALPVAMFMARVTQAHIRRLLLLVLLLPLLMNLVLQSYGWLVLLAPDGLLNRGLRTLGLTERPILFLFNESGVMLGMVQTAFPLAVLPIANAFKTIPSSLEEAAALLGANRLRVIWHIMLPLAAQGIIAASLLVFAFNVSAFVVPFLLGGRRVSMLALLIRDQMGPLLNWPLGAANSVVLVVLALLVLTAYQTLARRRQVR
ncbi:ABC transporter permease [Hypericibacter sp.]|uniref:ABC transporter permease n=1 Tax=Hypericibacter sp. TaxID=2705401 RepID=UPI003D6CC818